MQTINIRYKKKSRGLAMLIRSLMIERNTYVCYNPWQEFNTLVHSDLCVCVCVCLHILSFTSWFWSPIHTKLALARLFSSRLNPICHQTQLFCCLALWCSREQAEVIMATKFQKSLIPMKKLNETYDKIHCLKYIQLTSISCFPPNVNILVCKHLIMLINLPILTIDIRYL